MKVDGSLRSLIQGVSQQPEEIRLPGQCTAQENFSSNPVDGLTRRAPTVEIASLFSTALAVQFYDFSINNVNYIVTSYPGSLRVFTQAGVEKTVIQNNSSFAYLDGGSLAFTTSNNITYVVNRSKIALMKALSATYAVGQGVIYIKGGQYGRIYEADINAPGSAVVTMTIAAPGVVTLNGHGFTAGKAVTFSTTGALPTGLVAGTTYYVSSTGITTNTFQLSTSQANALAGTSITTSGSQSGVQTINTNIIVASYTTPTGSVSTDISLISTVNIAQKLTAALQANPMFTASFTATNVADHILIKSNTNTPFTMTVSDGEGNADIFQITNTIVDAADLPKYASQGQVVSITGTGNSAADNWYAQFNCNGTPPTIGTGFGTEGTWNECVAPGINFQMDSTTVPHILTYDANTDQFTFDLAGFANRAAGDYTTNPDPSFIGATIEDIFFFQGRLGFLSGPNVILSKTNKPFIFWKNSATTLADSDPIDVFSTAKGVTKMSRAVPFNRDLILFSNKGQFILFGRNAITPVNTSLVLTTTFEANLNATPVAAGRNIFFGQTFGSFTGIREFYADGVTDENDARTITQQTLKYLQGSITLLSTSTNFDILLVATDHDKKTLYTYEYIWDSNKKIQSSWSKWTFDMDIVFSYIQQSLVTFVQRIGNEYILSQMDLDIQNDAALSYQVKLDRKKTATVAGTTLANPYAQMPADPTTIVFVQGAGCPTPGLKCYVTDYNAGTNTFTFSKNMGGGTVIYGTKYRSSYIPSNPRIRDADGVTVGTGKLRVNKWIITFTNTGFLGARVFSPFNTDLITTFTGRYVGDPTTFVGVPAIVSGRFKIPFRNNIDNANLEIYSDSHYPLTLTVMEWQGQYTKRGTRIAGTGGANGRF